MENITPNKIIYDKTQYQKVIDTSFTQLVQPQVTSSVSTISVQEFFQYYQDLFFIIPKFGDINSHEYLIKTSGEYIGTTNINDDTKMFKNLNFDWLYSSRVLIMVLNVKYDISTNLNEV
jgi:hypothetical protein